MMTPDDIRTIHQAGLRLLGKAGVVFKHQPTVDLFAAHGFKVDGLRVFMTEAHVEAALAVTPSWFTVEGRSPDRHLFFGGDHLVVANAAGAAFVLDGADMRAGTMADLSTCLKLSHMSLNVDMLGNPILPQDVPVAEGYRQSIHCCLTMSDKLLEYPIATQEHLQVALDTSEILYGADWHQRSRVFTVLNSVSPLQFEEGTCISAMELAARNQPICLTPCVMGGTTGPVTTAGILVLQHAEVLAGLVLVQLVRPGCPFVYGGTSSISSMMTGDMLVGVPEYWALMTATVEIANHFDLPSRAGGGLTDAHLPDMQAGIECAMGLATVMRTGVNFILHGTGIISSFNAVSFAKFVIDDELVGMLRSRLKRIEVSDETMAVSVIEDVGPGGNFLMESHTYAHCHDYDRPSFFNRRKHDVWLSRGGLDIASSAEKRVKAMLESYVTPDLDPLILRQLGGYCFGRCTVAS